MATSTIAPTSVTSAINATMGPAGPATPYPRLVGRCPDPLWYLHLVAGLASLAIGPLIILTGRLVGLALAKVVASNRLMQRAIVEVDPESSLHPDNNKKSLKKQKKARKKLKKAQKKRTCPSAVRDWAAGLLCAQSPFGLGLMLAAFFLSMASFAIYATEAAALNGLVEYCARLQNWPLLCVDLAFNCIFGLHFCLRCLAAQDRLAFWLELQSVIDYCTVPSTLLGACIGQYWLGLRFMRGLRLLALPDLLLHLGLARSGYSIRLLQLFTIFIGVWLIGAGTFHVLENFGDAHRQFENNYNIGFGDSLYFTIVTMSTVGYGDISPRTDSGRVFACLYILFALSVFASHIPEMAQMLTSASPYAGSYRKETGRPHLVVCGAVCHQSMESFLADLLHKDRKRATARNLHVVCIGQFRPDLEFQGLLKRHFRKLAYFEGTILSPHDCTRVALDSAEAAVVLANKYADDPDEEDATNIMRAIAIKNAAPGQRCIVQLLRQRNRFGLLIIPSWDWRLGDECVCISELTLGLLAQSCTAPGFSTLMANLLAVRSMSPDCDVGDSWEADYRRGSCYEIYSVRLGAGLHGVTFAEAAAACFASKGVILLALEEPDEENDANETAIAGSQAIYRRQGRQHHLLLNPNLQDNGAGGTGSGACSCVIRQGSRGLFLADSYDEARRAAELAVSSPRVCSMLQPSRTMPQVTQSVEINDGGEDLLDSTGSWHWCPARRFEEALRLPSRLRGHHILCVVAACKDTAAAGLGLVSFLRPLRSSSLRRRELSTVVLVGGGEYLRLEWPALRHFPDLYALIGSPMSRATLRRASLHTCDTCVIVGARSRGSTRLRDPIDPYLMDREVVLCTLNIRALDAERAARSDVQPPPLPTPVVTEIFMDKNVQFLDQEDDDSRTTEMHNTQQFACGSAFAASALDSLLSTVFYNQSAMSLIRALVTGGAEPLSLTALDAESQDEEDFEEQNAAGNRDEHNLLQQQHQQGTKSSVIPDRKHRSRVARMLLTDQRLAPYSRGNFGDLFLGLLRSYGILCLGIARFRDAYRRTGQADADATRAAAPSSRRFVIACPSAEFRLLSTDAVYCLVPFPVALNVE